MGEMTNKAKAKLNDMENKAHELKGRIKQKVEDTKADTTNKL